MMGVVRMARAAAVVGMAGMAWTLGFAGVVKVSVIVATVDMMTLNFNLADMMLGRYHVQRWQTLCGRLDLCNLYDIYSQSTSSDMIIV